MEEFTRIVERFIGLVLGLIILYVFLTTILKIDNKTYLTIARDILTAYAVKW